MSQNDTSVAELPNDTYPEIRKMWMEEWEQARVNFTKGRIKLSKWLIVTGTIAILLIAILMGQFSWTSYHDGEGSWFVPLIFGAVLAGLFLGSIVAPSLVELHHPEKNFRLEPENFATFWWHARLEEPVVSYTAHEILSRVEDGNEPTEEERNAIIQICAEALMDLRMDYAWGSPTQKIIGLRAISCSEGVVRDLPIKSILDVRPATNGDSISSSTKDFDHA